MCVCMQCVVCVWECVGVWLCVEVCEIGVRFWGGCGCVAKQQPVSEGHAPILVQLWGVLIAVRGARPEGQKLAGRGDVTPDALSASGGQL